METLSVHGEDDLNQDELDYLDALTNLVEIYDNQRYPEPDDGAPLERLKALLEEANLSTADLGRLLGNIGLASQIILGRRQLCKAHVRILSRTAGEMNRESATGREHDKAKWVSTRSSLRVVFRDFALSRSRDQKKTEALAKLAAIAQLARIGARPPVTASNYNSRRFRQDPANSYSSPDSSACSGWSGFRSHLRARAVKISVASSRSIPR
jgi:antitoxin component HigA of HigAB toxin-antitoxin module